ncbi:MAG: hypothetical protein WCJ19_02035 [bacterium]
MLTQSPSKTLIKLVDLAVVPAAVLVFTKIISILLLNAVLGLSWDVKTFSDAFFGVKLSYSSVDELTLVISYSNLFMLFAAITGAVLTLLKLFYLHPTHIKPSVVLKLAKSDKLHYIQSTFHLYHEAIVWCVFLIVADVIILINYVQNLTYNWILGFSMICTLFLVFILVRTIDRDLSIKNIKYK